MWPGAWQTKAAVILRLDLASADIPHTTPDGRLDFHALRGSLATLLIAAGTDPKTVQAILRHASIATTMAHYARVRAADNAAALGALPAIAGTTAGTDSLREIQEDSVKCRNVGGRNSGRRKRQSP